VEEQCFADDTGVGVLLRVEDELIDDYVRGALSDSDRQLFESHFLCTEGRRQRLETVKYFVEVLGQRELAGRAASFERPRRPLAHEERRFGNIVALAGNQLAPEGFARLLSWLDSDYQRAAEKLLSIRDRIIKLFTVRGISDAEKLADDTIDRVVSKVADSTINVSDPAIYFYTVANRMMLEGARAKQSARDVLPAAVMDEVSVSEVQKHSCLEKCLQQLPESDRDLILDYYPLDKGKRLDFRKELAQSLGISQNVLRLRVHRIRRALEKCISSCLQHEREQADDATIRNV
jgi:DNA-directed RNA polymerase specialized sigma24 family protein